MKGDPSSVEGFYIRLQHGSRDANSPQTSAISTPGALHGVQTGPSRDTAAAFDGDSLDEGSSAVVTVLNAGSGLSSYILQGLHNYRAYTVFLVPFFDTYEGRPSNSLTFVTPIAGNSFFNGLINIKGIYLLLNYTNLYRKATILIDFFSNNNLNS